MKIYIIYLIHPYPSPTIAFAFEHALTAPLTSAIDLRDIFILYKASERYAAMNSRPIMSAKAKTPTVATASAG